MTDEERIERLENKLKEALSWWKATEKQFSQKCKETKANQKTIERLKAENAELRRHAEVAERALLLLCDKVMRDILVMVFPSTKTQVRNKQELYDYYLKQAEKDLAD